MKAGWREVLLGDVTRPVVRTVAVEAGRRYRTIGVKWWGEGAYERQTIDGSETAATSLSVVRAGDLIINKIWVRHGSTAIAGTNVDGCAASGEFPTFELDPSQVLCGWMHWMSKTKSFWSKCDALSQGSSGKNRIKPELFLTIRIPLPPLDEQRRIVARIETVANALTRIEELQSEVAALSDTTVLSLHHTLAAGASRHLRDLIELYEVAVDVESSASYPQVGVRSFGAGLFSKAATLGSSTTYKRFNTLYEGAIVLSQVKGWEGALALCPSELAGWFVSPEYRTFRCRDSEVVPEYIGRMIRTAWFWNKLQAATRGVGARRERTRPEQFLDIELNMPTVRDQQRALVVIERLQKVDSLRKSTQPQRAALLPAILDRAFKGEL